MRNERGNILVSALIGAGIVSATGLALATMMTQMNHESRSLAQKLEIMQLEQTMMGDLANSAIWPTRRFADVILIRPTPLILRQEILVPSRCH